MKTKLSKQEILERVGTMAQLAGIRPYVLREGRKNGVSAADLWNGSGLSMTVLSDRASDIYSVTYQGRSLCWLSGVGASGPWFAHNGPFEWDKNFGGGMLATCGLTTAGLPSARTQRPVRNMTSGTTPCAGMCGAAPRASPLWTIPAKSPGFGMCSTFPIPACGKIPATPFCGSFARSMRRRWPRRLPSGLERRPKTTWRNSLKASRPSLSVSIGWNTSGTYIYDQPSLSRGSPQGCAGAAGTF